MITDVYYKINPCSTSWILIIDYFMPRTNTKLNSNYNENDFKIIFVKKHPKLCKSTFDNVFLLKTFLLEILFLKSILRKITY